MKLLNTIRILSRKSDLAIIQAKEVGSLLKEKYPELTLSYSRRLRGFYEASKYMLYHNKN